MVTPLYCGTAVQHWYYPDSIRLPQDQLHFRRVISSLIPRLLPVFVCTYMLVVYVTVPAVELTISSTTWLAHTVYETKGFPPYVGCSFHSVTGTVRVHKIKRVRQPMLS